MVAGLRSSASNGFYGWEDSDLEIVQWILLGAVILITLYLLVSRLQQRPPEQPDRDRDDGDGLTVATVPPFEFQGRDPSVAARILEAVNRMGGVGDDAEEKYQSLIHALRSDSADIVRAIGSELSAVPETRHLDRWSLIQLLAELRDPAALGVLDNLLSRDLPPELSRDPHSRSTLRQETINLTTAVEAIARIAADDNAQARELLLKHASHQSLSVRRACIQAYLAYGGGNARGKLLELLPKNDHWLLDVRRIDVRESPPLYGADFTRPSRAAVKPSDTPRVPPARNG
ncbi:MAG: hypothetical protein L0271_10890 [Gemmatimonadetes bacterium]|nr:hypothetical protein [Gemmatimonadota bacterium]